jgi:hypothetical protein
MKYFVSIENNNYHHWQIELLIQSFKMVGLQDDLHISIAENRLPQSAKYIHNLKEHKNKYICDNPGRKNGCLSLNKISSLKQLIDLNILGDQFVVMHPDMILFRGINDLPADSQLIYHRNGDNEDSITSHIKKNVTDLKVPWMSMGDTMVFNKCPVKFFEIVQNQMIDLMNQFGGRDWDIEKNVWICAVVALLKQGTRLKINQVQLEMSLLHPNKNTSMIHYTHGIPPVFHKKYYENIKGGLIVTSANDPLDSILLQNPTTASNYLHQVIFEYRKEIKKKNLA